MTEGFSASATSEIREGLGAQGHTVLRDEHVDRIDLADRPSPQKQSQPNPFKLKPMKIGSISAGSESVVFHAVDALIEK